MKTLLLVSVSALALTTGAASPAQNSLPMVMKSSHNAFHFTPRQGSTVLYDQVGSSTGYGVSSVLLESSAYSIYDSQGADDFVIPGTAEHHITQVFAPGQNAYGSGYTASNFQVTFYKKIKVGKRGTKVKVLKSCPNSPARALNGDGNVLIDVSSCGSSKGVKVKGGKDYSVSVQAITPSGLGEQNWWYWYTLRIQAYNPGLWQNFGGGFALCTSWESIKTCFPTSGVGPDLRFELIGK